MADRDEKTVPYEIDVRIVGDLGEVFLAVRLAIGDPVELMSHKHATTPEEQRDLKWLLEGWGWSLDGDRLGGLWGDWSEPTDDERLFTALAPHVAVGSQVIVGEYRSEHGPFFAWVFRDGTVTRRPVERRVEFDVR